MIRRLIALVLDRNAARNLEREVDKSMGKIAQDSESKMSQAFKRIGGIIAAAFSIRAIVGFTREMFKLGSSAAETGSKFETVFGSDRARELDAFLEKFAHLAGMTKTEGRDMLAISGSIAQGMGFAADESAKFAQSIVTLAGDLKSFHDVPIAEAFAAIRSGLTGEQEPLKRFGIMLDAATVKTRALADRSREVTGELTQQELATARLAIITERAGVVIGDLDRTQNSAANTAARITATYRQLREDLATGLLPIFGMVVTAWGDVASGAHGAVNVLDGFFTRIGDFVEMVQRLAVNYNAMFRSLPALLKQFLASQLNDMVTEFLEPLEGIVNRLRGAFGKEAVDFTSGLAAFAGRLRDEAAADIAAWKALMDQEVQAIIDARTVIQEHRAAPGVGATEGKEGGGGAGLDIPNVARREMEVSVSGLGEAGVAIQDELVAIESGLESVNPFGRMIEEVDLTAAYMRDGFRGVGQAIVSQLIAGRAEEQFASGLAALASGIWPPNPAALFAAGKHFAAAAAFKVLGGALGGALGGGGGGSGGGGSVPPGAIATSAPSISQLPGTEVNIFLDQLSPADPRFQRVVLGTVQNARERFGDNVRVNVHPRSTG